MVLALGAPLTATKGYTAPEAAAAYRRAAELCALDGRRDARSVPRALRHLARAAAAARVRARRSRSPAGSRSSRRAAATRCTRPPRTARSAARCSTSASDLDAACTHLEQRDRLRRAARLAHELHRGAARRHRPVDRLPRLPVVGALAAGPPGRGARDERPRDAASRASSGIPSRACSRSPSTAWLCQFEGDVEATRWRAADALALATEQGFAFWIGWNEIIQGWAWAAGGRPEAGRRAAANGPGPLARARLGAGQPVLLLAAVLRARGDGRPARSAPRARRAPRRSPCASTSTGGAPSCGGCGASCCSATAARPTHAEAHFTAALELALAHGAVALAERAERSLASVRAA